MFMIKKAQRLECRETHKTFLSYSITFFGCDTAKYAQSFSNLLFNREQHENAHIYVTCLRHKSWPYCKSDRGMPMLHCLKWETENQTSALLQHGSD